MKMDRRLTNGLAWAGALLVIGVPAADFLTGSFAEPSVPTMAVVDASPEPASQTTAVAPTPAVRPAAPATQQTASNAVDGFMQSGRPLPSYITGGEPAAQPVAAPVKPAPAQASAPPQTAAPQPVQTATTPPVVTQPTPTANAPLPIPAQGQQVAALPVKVAPMPMPLSMRPQPVTVPLATNQPLIIDQTTAISPPPRQAIDPGIITAEDLDSWESGPLSEFLAQRGQQSSATYQVQQNQPAYEPEGFWLDEGPRSNRADRRFQRPEDEVYYVPF